MLVEGCKHEIEITVPVDEIARETDRVVADIQHKAKRIDQTIYESEPSTFLMLVSRCPSRYNPYPRLETDVHNPNNYNRDPFRVS